mmetsp:Transcript_44790/g.101124  ORF Transcript_44790/g.101124 Transcript_44790/m.101124 type:complete len:87 (-) Transcript_44790:958-1218(-)
MSQAVGFQILIENGAGGSPLLITGRSSADMFLKVAHGDHEPPPSRLVSNDNPARLQASFLGRLALAWGSEAASTPANSSAFRVCDD